MAEIESFIENSMRKIKNLNNELHQETNYLNFLRCCKKDLDEAEKIKNENSIKISELNSKISWYERKLKSRDSLLTKMDTEMNQMKMENAVNISQLKANLSLYSEDLEYAAALIKKLYKAMDEYYIANKKLNEKLDGLQEQIERVVMQRDDNRALYNYTR